MFMKRLSKVFLVGAYVQVPPCLPEIDSAAYMLDIIGTAAASLCLHFTFSYGISLSRVENVKHVVRHRRVV